jgi:hypothetical protein
MILGTYHCTNTAEAAFILHEKRGIVELKAWEYHGDEDKVTIVLEESDDDPGHIGEAIDRWPGSEYFKYFAMLNWLNLGIKRLKEANKCPVS